MRYETILVGTDFSPLAEVAVHAAMRAARRFGVKSLHVVHVAAIPQALGALLGATSSYGELLARSVADAKIKLEEADLGEVPGGLTVVRDVKLGIPAREIAKAAQEIGADLIMVASHGRTGLERFFIGSVTNALIRVAHCPILIVGKGREGLDGFERVTAAVDLSPVSRNVLAHAHAFASAHAGRVTLLSIHDIPELAPRGDDLLPGFSTTSDLLALHDRKMALLEALVASAGLDREEVEVRSEAASDAITAILASLAVGGADLAVVGTSGHNAWQRAILGSTATRVVAEAPCSVLVVPFDTADAVTLR
jgi:nucleotide-binding universal stress UspA family protein